MKKSFILVLVAVFFLVSTGRGNAVAISYYPGNQLTQVDKTTATNFFNGLKWDLLQSSKNIVKITMPKVDGNKYEIDINQGKIDQDESPIPGTGSDIYQGAGGLTLTRNFSETTEFTFYFYNIDTGKTICVEVYIIRAGNTSVRHPDSATYALPAKDKNGNIMYWVNLYGDKVNPSKNDSGGDTPKPTTRFTDVSEKHWVFNVINQLYDLGYIKGYPEGTFIPDGNITRAEFAVMLRNVLKDKYLTGATFKHDDLDIIPSWHWSSGAVMELFTYMPANDISLIFGKAFDPDRIITREEVVAILAYTMANHKNFKNDTTKPSLIDIGLSVYTDSISFSVNNNLVVGYPDGTFRPKNNITRAEIVAVMVKVLSKM
ncbi:MAG: S-layer homology domain-containing protein [Eubacteriales bacterium]